MSLYMFRALNAHLQEDTLYTFSIWYCHSLREFVVGQLVEALRYKPECHVFEFRWWNFSIEVRSTQPLTEMRRPVHKADNLTTFMCRLS